MPDADDFDVEYFRDLLKGTVEKNNQPGTAARKSKQPPGKTTPAKTTNTAKVVRRKSKKG
jgi:hypothetical protein